MLEAERAIHGSRGLRESLVKVGYVVLYVDDVEACRRFWVEQIGMVEKRRTEAGDFTIAQVGFADQPFAFELVPLAMMQDNPDHLDLATPSICFSVVDLEATHAALIGRGVQASDVGEHNGTRSFALSWTPRDVGSRSRSSAVCPPSLSSALGRSCCTSTYVVDPGRPGEASADRAWGRLDPVIATILRVESLVLDSHRLPAWIAALRSSSGTRSGRTIG